MSDTSVRVEEVGIDGLQDYAHASIAFSVTSRFRVDLLDGGLGGIALREEAVDPPYTKQYDDVDEERPLRWARRWDLSNWGIFAAFRDERRIGGAVIATDTEGVNMLEGRKDLAVLWDIRVDEDARGMGAGRALFQYGEQWARERGCTQLKVETQNINIPACRFYVSQGCHLGGVNQYAYLPEFPDEVQLLWYKQLS